MFSFIFCSVKTLLAISKRLCDFLAEDYPNLQFSISFFRILSLFDKVRKSSLSKNLESDWDAQIKEFLSHLEIFIAKSNSIGYVNIHYLVHTLRICKKYNLGLASLGADSQVEAYHAFIESKIKLHLGQAPATPDNSFVYTKENLPPDHIQKYYIRLFARCLEASLVPNEMKKTQINHEEYGRQITIDAPLIRNLIKNLNFKPNQKIFSKTLKPKNFDEFTKVDQSLLDGLLLSNKV